jgi:hypothetical protein
MQSNFNMNNNSGGGSALKSDVKDERYLQWLRNIQEELSSNSANENLTMMKT